MKTIQLRALWYKPCTPKMKTVTVDDDFFAQIPDGIPNAQLKQMLDITIYDHNIRRYQIQYEGKIIYSSPGAEYPCDSVPWDEATERNRERQLDMEERKYEREVRKRAKQITAEQIAEFRKGVADTIRGYNKTQNDVFFDEEYIHHEAYVYLSDKEVADMIAREQTPEEYADMITM